MKKSKRFAYTILSISILSICTLLALATPHTANSAVDVQDFYFRDMHVDYNLSRDPDGISHLKVVESLTAEFPNFDQNKGIERAIPVTNQNGENVTFVNPTVTVTRNGQSEPIWDTENTSDYYLVSTGTNDYLYGEQVYGFNYSMERVITEFSDHQELYWDVNGTGWSQHFNQVSATIHFDDASAKAFDSQIACYTGVLGSEQSDCSTVIATDGKSVTITSDRQLNPYENLTFVIGFTSNAFVVPEPEVSYIGVIVLTSILALSLIAVIAVFISIFVYYFRQIRRDTKQHERPIVPEYLPPKNISVFEASGLLQKQKANPVPAQIIDLAIRKKVKIIESEQKGIFGKSKSYSLELLSTEELRPDEQRLLRILFPGDKTSINLNDHIPVNIASSLSTFTENKNKRLQNDGYIDKNATKKNNKFIFISFIAFFILIAVQASPLWLINIIDGGIFVGIVQGITITISFPLAFIGNIFCIKTFSKPRRTELGWDMYYYLRGLELYIHYAETDRLKFHQSVEGAQRIDITNKVAVVKLYEKLLPFAILFGLEKSWAETIQLYASELDTSPSWVSTVDTFNMVTFMSSTKNGFVQSVSQTYSTASGSSSSSGFSGGGSSGGGGGGGGGGGR